MIVVGILASLVLLVVIIRFALSKQTDKLVKRAAIIALAVIGIAVVICLIAIVSGPKAVEEEPVFTGFALEEPVQQATNPAAVYALIFGVIMALFIALIIFLSMRDKNRADRS
jgi:protein-S-isoprenylcysteine O-methyltransferase Ste14